MTTENPGWVAADELQDKRLDNVEQRLVLLEQTLIEVKGMLRVVKALAISAAGVLGLNVHQLML
jgi:hypothetical protein